MFRLCLSFVRILLSNKEEIVMSNNNNEKYRNPALRRKYIIRFIGRCVVLLISVLLFIFRKDQFEVLDGWNFFKKFSIFHLLWAVWIVDMVFQVIPARKIIPIGSQKHLRAHFIRAKEKINKDALKSYIVSTTKSAYRVMLLWIALLAVISSMYYAGVLSKSHLLMISILFYVFDLICVLIWCPFRLMMGNKCCTTCRIFNWDHFMMFSPIVFMGGFFSLSLFAFAVAVLIVWEVCVFLYPERFWEKSNMALKCSECTDKLCTQYCQRLRKKSADTPTEQ